jgi:type I restriction enzyme, S subunit
VSSWPVRRLGDVVEAKYGKALPKAKRSGGDVPVFGSNGVVGHHNTAVTSGPTIVVGRKGSVGAVSVSSGPCWPIDTTYYIDDFGPCSIDFLEQLLRALDLQRLDRSTAIPGLSREQLYELPVPIPPSEVQAAVVRDAKRLHELRTSAAAHITAARRELDRLRRATLVAASTGDLAVSGDWPRVRLSDVASRITKGTTPTSIGHKFTDSGVSFVKVENLRAGRIDRASIRAHISEETNRTLARSMLEAGDVLFSIAGTIGRTAVVRREDLPANTNQALAIIRGVGETFEPAYLGLALQGAVQGAAADAARGSGMNNISLSDVRAFELAAPPLDLQKEIVSASERIFAEIRSVDVRLREAERQVDRAARASLLEALQLDFRNGEPE